MSKPGVRCVDPRWDGEALRAHVGGEGYARMSPVQRFDVRPDGRVQFETETTNYAVKFTHDDARADFLAGCRAMGVPQGAD